MRRDEGYSIKPFGVVRQIGSDWLEMGLRKHHVTALLELDVTVARAAIRRHRRQTGEQVSLFSWLVKCIGQAVAEHPEVNAYRGRQGIVIFDDVDISIVVEKRVEGQPVPAPYVIRQAERKDAAQIQAEIRAAQEQDVSRGYQVLGEAPNPFMGLVRFIPPLIRRIIWSVVLADPFRTKRMMGTVIVTSLMSGSRFKGWAIPIGVHTACFALGSVVRKPGVVDGRIEAREYLNLTVRVDHDVVDGMPVARFLSRLAELVEKAEGLCPGNS